MRSLVLSVFLVGCARQAHGVHTAPDAPPAVDAAIDAAVDAAPLPACTAPGSATFTFDPSAVISPDLVGFGAQYNGNAYADISVQAGLTADLMPALEAKAIAMQPRHVRIFWNPTATPDQVTSFERVVDLAERSGATINITYWHGPYPDPSGQMQAFSDELVRLVHDLHHDAVRYITIQNEVNSTMVTQSAYEQLYRTLDQDLRTAGERDHIKFVCGDLLRTNQQSWFDYMAANMSDVCDGYSVHIYWNFADTGYMLTRLNEVHDIVAAMPASARKPVYITEFGVKGNSPAGEPDPGLYSDGELLGRTNENAFQHAWFDVVATRLGYVSTLKWDAFFAKYDNGLQYFSSIGIPPDFFLKPVYFQTQLFTRSVLPGWSSVHVSGGNGSSDPRLLTGFAGANGDATVVALNSSTSSPQTVDVTGLPPGTPVQVLVWHGEGNGDLTTSSATTGADCTLSFKVPARSVAAVTTLRPAM
jgi:hypothetical protein